MATAVAHFSAPGLALSFFKNLWATLVWLGESNARAGMLRELTALSDAELAAKGLTRQDLVQRIFDDSQHI